MSRWERALVTGASRGIGEAFARRLAAAGTDLVLVARSEDELRELADELHADQGVQVDVLAADLTSPTERRPVEDRLASVELPVDLLINNAGFGSSGLFHELDLERETGQIALNLTTTTRLTRAALGQMVASGRGGVINVASILAFQPGPHGAVYAACKAAVLSMTEAVHEEVRGTGVHVTALCPGFTRTAIFDVAGGDTSRVPAVMWKEPDEVAGAGLRAVAANDAVCVPGLLYQAQATSAPRLFPPLKRRVAGAVGRRF